MALTDKVRKPSVRQGISTDKRQGEDKMKRNVAIAFLVLAASFICVAEDNSDERIRRMIVMSNFYIDNPDAAYRMFMNARRRCGTDTNRFARLLAEVAQTNNAWVAQDAILSLGEFGTSAQLPLLYSLATNEQHGASAVKSILRLEGVTSNSVSIAGTYLSMTNIDFEYRAEACKSLLRMSAQSYVVPATQRFARNCVLRYARKANRYVMDVDAVFMETDQTYRNSRRRLDVLRSVYDLGVSQYQIAYVTNAINELVAYPEAELPE